MTTTNHRHVVRGGCLRITDPMSVWTSYSGVMSAGGTFTGFRTSLTMRAPR